MFFSNGSREGMKHGGMRLCGIIGAVLALPSCGDASDVTVLGGASEARWGTLSIPLDTTGSSGASYRLSASLLLTGPQEETVLLSGAVPAVEVRLASGSYRAFLNDPWRLSRLEAEGPRAVDAVLVSENPAAVQIEPEATTRLVLRFRVEGGEVVPADEGALEVTVEVDDTPPGTGACGEAGASPCLEQLLDDAAQGLGSASSCLPAQALATPLGNVQVCDDGVLCADGSRGCIIGGLDAEIATQVSASGPIELSLSAALRAPASVPLRVPALLGGGTCRLAVNAAFPGARATLRRVAAGGGQVGLEMGGVSLGPASVDVSLQQGGLLCDTVVPLAEDLIEQELQALAGELVLGSVPGLVESLTCTECPTGCALRCQPSL